MALFQWMKTHFVTLAAQFSVNGTFSIGPSRLFTQLTLSLSAYNKINTMKRGGLLVDRRIWNAFYQLHHCSIFVSSSKCGIHKVVS